MPSKNSVNRPKNKNTARAKAQHKSAVARRTPQTDIIHGKVDSKKVQQKKLRKARLASAHAAATADDAQDVEMVLGDEENDDDSGVAATDNKIDTRAKKQARKAKIAAEASQQAPEEKEFKMDTNTGKGTTLGGPPSASK